LSGKLLARTPQTVVNKKALMTKFEEVLQDGYAIDNEESELAMQGIAAPIFDATSQVIAAVGLVGPVHRLGKAKLKKLAPGVMQTARTISLQLGYVNEKS
jgi:DNA-binding IclR family transcriptional regulator